MQVIGIVAAVVAVVAVGGAVLLRRRARGQQLDRELGNVVHRTPEGRNIGMSPQGRSVDPYGDTGSSYERRMDSGGGWPAGGTSYTPPAGYTRGPAGVHVAGPDSGYDDTYGDDYEEYDDYDTEVTRDDADHTAATDERVSDTAAEAVAEERPPINGGNSWAYDTSESGPSSTAADSARPDDTPRPADSGPSGGGDWGSSGSDSGSGSSSDSGSSDYGSSGSEGW